ncbi:MAG: hypothetical protein ABFC85_11545 [Rectinema sp.]
MHTCELIARAIPEEKRPALPCEPHDGVCCVTGERGRCLPRSTLILQSLTDLALFKAPSSPDVGVDVWTSWRYGWTTPGKKKDMRPEANQCWLVNAAGFQIVARRAIREIVLNGSPASPWAMWVTTAYKKHGSLRARVNYEPRGIVAFDELIIDTSAPNVGEWWTIMTAAQKAGVRRTLQEDCSCPAGLMRKIGFSTWMKFEAWAKPKQQTPLYRLLCYLLPSREEMSCKKE